MEVLNGKTHGFIGEDKIYIGRYNKTYNLQASILANPFIITSEEQREESIKKYTKYIFSKYCLGKGSIYKELNELANLYIINNNINLICWCTPKQCHGDILKKLIILISKSILENNKNDSNYSKNSK